MLLVLNGLLLNAAPSHGATLPRCVISFSSGLSPTSTIACNGILGPTIISEIEAIRPWHMRLLNRVSQYGTQKLTLFCISTKTFVFADFHL